MFVVLALFPHIKKEILRKAFPKPPYQLKLLDHRQTKLWRPAPNSRQARELLNNDRLVWSRKVSAITGHGPYNYHDHRVDPVNFPTNICDRCDLGVIQDARHIFTECPAFATLRQEVFENFEPNQDHRPSVRQIYF